MKNKIYLIAGHSLVKAGAMGYLNEALEAIILRTLIEGCIKDIDPTIEVLIDDDKASLSKVIKWVKGSGKKNDLLLSIHFNAATPQATGVETLVYRNTSRYNRKIASRIQELTSRVLGLKDRGVKNDNSGQHSSLGILSKTPCKSSLLEVCFCSNKEDAQKYILRRDELARGIAKILVDEIRG